MNRRTLGSRLAALEQRHTPTRYVVRWELDGVRYDRSPDYTEAQVVPPGEDLGDATLILVCYVKPERFVHERSTI